MKGMNNKGWVRIIEVFLAIMIIIGAILIIASKIGPKTDISDSVYQTQREILDLMSKNSTLRTEIIETSQRKNNPIVQNFIYDLAPIGWEYSTNICSLNEVCPNPKDIYSADVYSTEVIITSNLTDYSPKKVRFFAWIKQ